MNPTDHNHRIFNAHRVAFTASFALLLAWVGCSDAQQQPVTQTPYPNTLQTALAERSQIPHVIEVPASLRSYKHSRISAEIMGRIQHLDLQLGQRVEADEELIQLHAPEIFARLEQAQVAHAQATRDLEREQKLLERGAATSVGIQALEDRVTSSRAQLDEAEAMLAKISIRAPFKGTVSRIHVEVGDLATPGQPLIEIDAGAPFEIEAALPESTLASLRVGQQLTAQVGDQHLSVTLTELSSRINPQNRTVEAHFGVDADTELSAGSFARIQLPFAARDRVQVPSKAVRRFGQMDQIFVIENDHARMRLVRLGEHQGDNVEIISGLEGGETVVLNPSSTLRSGQPVTIRN